MFIGGALSIDKAWRHEGYSYWSDEELSEQALDKLVAVYVHNKPDIMVTHECPESIAAMIVQTISGVGNGETKLDPRFASRTRQAFERMFALHQPKLHIFGHWHIPFDYTHEGTRFICLPELATIDVDTEMIEVIENGALAERPKAAGC